MKKSILKSAIVAIMVLIIASASLLTACVNTNNNNTLIGISLDKKEAYKGETLNLKVFVRPEGAYTISANPSNLVSIDGDNVTFTGDIEEDTDVTLTATLDSDKNVKDSVVVKYKAPAKPVVKTNITITADAKTAVKGDTVNFNVTVEPEAEYVITVNSEYSDVVSISEDYKSAQFIGDIDLDQFITFTATLVDDNSVKASVGITYKAPAKEGQVGELTASMIEAIGNQSITIVGTVTDYFVDLNNSSKNSTDTMDMTVKMEDGKWFGSWNYQDAPHNVIENSYIRGEDVVVGLDGKEGNILLQVYVDKDNKVTYKPITDYLSRPATWQSQHSYNHLGQLDVMTFEYNPESKIYTHQLDVNNKSDLYLMTYFAYSLTPMLEDTLNSISFVVEGGKIISMYGETEVLYDGGATTDPKEASTMSYTRFEVNFTEVGTTSVPEMSNYNAPENVEYLQNALNNMKNVNNYTFTAVDTTTRAPVSNESDYELQSTSAKNYVSSSGTVGLIGYVTEDAILLENTTKYSASMDGKDYKIEYTGYKQNADNTYQYFTYSSSDKALKGEQLFNGTLAKVLPNFEFSPNIFEFESDKTKNNVTYYTFVLRDATITRDVAMQVSMHRNAKDGAASTSSTFKIVVDDRGNVISTTFPYSITFGTYIGYIETTYSDFGTTTIKEGAFDDYIDRVWNNSWSDFMCKYYSAQIGVEVYHDENAQVVFNAVFPTKVLPTPDMFRNVFGDNLHIFYEYVAKEDAEGKILKDENGAYILEYTYIAINTEYLDNLDENGRISDINEVFDKILESFSVQGYVKDASNSGSKYGNNYLTITNEAQNLEIVFESNGTKNIFIEIHELGNWILK